MAPRSDISKAMSIVAAKGSIQNVFVAMGSSPGLSEKIRAESALVGELLAKRSYRLVYGGGEVGLMAIVFHAYRGHLPAEDMESRKAKACITEAFATMSGPTDKAETIVEKELHERVAYMLRAAEATVVLPGGIGTMHEKETGLAVDDMMRFIPGEDPIQPVILVNIDNYYTATLLQYAKTAMEEQTYAEKFRPLFVVDSAKEAVDMLVTLRGIELISARALYKGSPVPQQWPKSFADDMPKWKRRYERFEAFIRAGYPDLTKPAPTPEPAPRTR